MKDKELTELVDRLNRIFPYLEMRNESYYFDGDDFIKKNSSGSPPSYVTESDFVPPTIIDWYKIIEILNKNGLEIKNKKEK